MHFAKLEARKRGQILDWDHWETPHFRARAERMTDFLRKFKVPKTNTAFIRSGYFDTAEVANHSNPIFSITFSTSTTILFSRPKYALIVQSANMVIKRVRLRNSCFGDLTIRPSTDLFASGNSVLNIKRFRYCLLYTSPSPRD